MRRKGEKGQATLLVALLTGFLLLGALGLATDGSQLYAQYQKAQAAADAAAEAGAMSILGGTNTGAANTFGSTSFNCANGTDTHTPCLYAMANGFAQSGSTDQITVDFPTSLPGVALSPDFAHAAVQVTITRTVSTILMRLLGPSSSNITATGTAAIVQNLSPVPILVLDPSASGALQIGGTPVIQICGGPQESIQVNSRSGTAITQNGNAAINLSKGGPNDSPTSPCTTGTGSDVGSFGGPALGSGLPSWMTPTGASEHYNQPSRPMRDPLATVNGPSSVPPDGITTVVHNTSSPNYGCPVTNCTLYGPGHYSYIDVKNDTAVFSPGVYYIDSFVKISGVNTGFGNEANGNMMMCSGCGTSTDTGNAGMMVYLNPTAGTVNIGANATASLSGSSLTSPYKGMLFFMDRSDANLSPNLGGGGALALQGTIYLPTQNLSLQGGSGSGTFIHGDIIVNQLSLGGNSTITMQLDPNNILPVDTVALVR